MSEGFTLNLYGYKNAVYKGENKGQYNWHKRCLSSVSIQKCQTFLAFYCVARKVLTSQRHCEWLQTQKYIDHVVTERAQSTWNIATSNPSCDDRQFMKHLAILEN